MLLLRTLVAESLRRENCDMRLKSPRTFVQQYAQSQVVQTQCASSIIISSRVQVERMVNDGGKGGVKYFQTKVCKTSEFLFFKTV